MAPDDMLIFAGSGSPRLTGRICQHLQVTPAAGEVRRFSEGNLLVRVKENVRGRHVSVAQAAVFPADDHFMERSCSGSTR
jgi:ribose-phosphate pyrophosphokinase